MFKQVKLIMAYISCVVNMQTGKLIMAYISCVGIYANR